jgi:hypothetical protein
VKTIQAVVAVMVCMLFMVVVAESNHASPATVSFDEAGVQGVQSLGLNCSNGRCNLRQSLQEFRLENDVQSGNVASPVVGTVVEVVDASVVAASNLVLKASSRVCRSCECIRQNTTVRVRRGLFRR